MRHAGKYAQPKIFCEKAIFLDKLHFDSLTCTVKLGFKERLNKEQIGNSEQFSVPNLVVYSTNSEKLALVNNFLMTKKFFITKFDCTAEQKKR